MFNWTLNIKLNMRENSSKIEFYPVKFNKNMQMSLWILTTLRKLA